MHSLKTQPYAATKTWAGLTSGEPTTFAPSHTMLARSVLRAAPRAPGQASQAAVAVAAARTWQPARQHLSRRHASTVRDQFRDQFRRSPIAFPFALVS